MGDRLGRQLAPSQNCNDGDQRSCPNFHSHSTEVKWGAHALVAIQDSNVRRFFAGRAEGGRPVFPGSGNGCKLIWIKLFDSADYKGITQSAQGVLGGVTVQGCHQLLLTWVENVLGEAAKISKRP
jgi:hypothetical protein